MAEGLLRHDRGDRFEVESAGTKPGQVRPEAIAVMKEVGIDISGHRSKSVDEFAGQEFDYVLTVCDNAGELPDLSRPHKPAASELRGPGRHARFPAGAAGGFPARSR